MILSYVLMEKIPNENLSRIFNSLKFGVDKLKASEQQMNKFLMNGGRMEMIKKGKKKYTYQEIKKVVDDYMSTRFNNTK